MRSGLVRKNQEELKERKKQVEVKKSKEKDEEKEEKEMKGSPVIDKIESSSDEEYSCDDSECDEPECEEKKKLKKNVKKTLIDFRKFTKKNQYSLIEIFGKSKIIIFK